MDWNMKFNFNLIEFCLEKRKKLVNFILWKFVDFSFFICLFLSYYIYNIKIYIEYIWYLIEIDLYSNKYKIIFYYFFLFLLWGFCTFLLISSCYDN